MPLNPIIQYILEFRATSFGAYIPSSIATGFLIAKGHDVGLIFSPH